MNAEDMSGEDEASRRKESISFLVQMKHRKGDILILINWAGIVFRFMRVFNERVPWERLDC